MMTRRIITLAASALALSTFGIAPLTAQANAISAQVNANVTSLVAVTTGPDTIALGAIDPALGANQNFPLTIESNNPLGYTVAFTGANSTAGFALANITNTSAPKITYTINGDDETGSNNTSTVLYAYNVAGPNLAMSGSSSVTNHFTVTVAAATAGQQYEMGSYNDTLTYTVAAAS
jgi:hypothetical protein